MSFAVMLEYSPPVSVDCQLPECVALSPCFPDFSVATLKRCEAWERGYRMRACSHPHGYASGLWCAVGDIWPSGNGSIVNSTPFSLRS